MRSCAAAKDRAVPVPIPRRPVLGGPEVVRVGLNTDHTSKTPRGEPGHTAHATRDEHRTYSHRAHRPRILLWHCTVPVRYPHAQHTQCRGPESRASG